MQSGPSALTCPDFVQVTQNTLRCYRTEVNNAIEVFESNLVPFRKLQVSNLEVNKNKIHRSGTLS